MLETVTELIDTPNGPHRVRTSGDGFPLAVIPGGPGFGALYLIWSLSSIADIDRRFVFIDQRGTGGSPAGSGPLTVSAYVDDMAEVLNAMSIDKCDLLCHSGGTPQTLHFAAQHPDRVRRIVVSEPIATSREMATKAMGPGSVFQQRRSSRDVEMMAEIEAQSGWMYDKDLVDSWFHARYRGFYVDPEFADRVPNDLVGAAFIQHRITQATFISTAFENLLPAPGSVSAPTLMIFALQSGFDGREEPYRTVLPEAEFAYLDCGHLPSGEDPDGFHDLVTAFLHGA
jgi:pimeloyl-ACP methyl ester carboxylesterase